MKKELVQGIRTPLLGFSSFSALASSSSSGVHVVPGGVLLVDGARDLDLELVGVAAIENRRLQLLLFQRRLNLLLLRCHRLLR